MDNDPKKDRYSVTLLFDHKNMDGSQKALLSAMKKAANDLAVEKFGVGLGKRHESGKIVGSPFRASEEKPRHYPEGMIFCKFSSKSAPNVVDRSKSPITEQSGDVYAGCWARLSYSVYKYDKSGNIGIAFGLNNLQKIGDDEPFGTARTTADDDFDAIDEPETASGGADDIPF
jgi:hypothetical protein